MTLSLNHVSKAYGRSAVRAVRDLDLDIRGGEFVALLGSSGCGKTSTLRVVAGFEAVTEGTITLAGRRIDGLAPAYHNVAMAFEGYALYPPLTIEENTGFGLGHGKSGVDPKQRVREVAELLEIGPILKRKPAGLSGGQQQRASLARALARDADLHLFDEPMGQLEPQLRAALPGLALPAAGAEVVPDVRPHAVMLGRGDWQGTVIFNHWLSDEAHVVLDVGGRTVVAHGRVAARAGNVMPLGFAPETMHLFNAETGRALMHGAKRA